MNEVISQGMFIDKDIWLMGYHPDDEEAEFVAEDVEVEEMVKEPYLMVFVQRLSKIQEAAYKLFIKVIMKITWVTSIFRSNTPKRRVLFKT